LQRSPLSGAWHTDMHGVRTGHACWPHVSGRQRPNANAPAGNGCAKDAIPGETIRVTATLRGDLHTPPEESALWQNIVLHHAQPGFRDEWVAVGDLPKRVLCKHPWTFSEDNERTRQIIERTPHTPLRKMLADDIGYGCITRTDEVFIQPPWVLRRFRIIAQ
jgi:hypothetical protein